MKTMEMTVFGHFIRRIRIDRGELLYDMARKLGVGPAYLSGVEFGKRKIPDGWEEKIARIYGLSEGERAGLFGAAAIMRETPCKKTRGLAAECLFESLPDDLLKKMQRVTAGESQRHEY
ncbi:MAG: hypothetical protein Pg6C_16820 [Treponemataceae bacterium]|nr:MAG: hypothetical protein Pg6C_16820 [Treponemataceae bacterium]